MLIKQPVKEAVREALAEDRARESSGTTPERESAGGPRGGGESGRRKAENGGSSGSMLGRVFVLAVLVGLAYYAKQRRGMDLGSDLTEEVGRAQSSGPSVEDPLSAEQDESSTESNEDQTDEGPTTPS